MKQNIYDNPKFFNGYMDLRANESGFNKAVEEPALYSLLPDLKGLKILDIGCGFGKFVSFCLQNNAKFVLGTDISKNMILEAEKQINDTRAKFKVVSAEDFNIDKESFDLIVSSMCFHYVKDIKPVFEKIYLSLEKNGSFIFSAEHPICTSLLKGWHSCDNIKKHHWPVDNYKEETIRKSTWFVDGVIKYHRTIETYINLLIDAGFSIKRLLEPGPSPSDIEKRPDLADHLRRPPIIVVAAQKQ